MTVEVLHAADSATARPELYDPERFRAWGIYVGGAATHVWTHAEVAELHAKGIAAVFPIVVLPQSWPWIYPEEQVITDLVREAEAWPVPKGSPLIWDIEEWQATKMGSQLTNVLGIIRGVTMAAGFRPVIYGSFRTIAARPQGNLVGLLAEWPEPSGHAPAEVPELAPGYFGRQYAGNVDGVDLDIIAVPTTLMATDFTHETGLIEFHTTTEGSTTVPLPTDMKEDAAAAHVAEPRDAVQPHAEEVSAKGESAENELLNALATKLGLPVETIIEAVDAVNAEASASLGDPEGTDVAEKDEPKAPEDNTPTHAPVDIGLTNVVDIAAHPSAGYYVLTANGHVDSVRCPHLGDITAGVDDAVAITVSPDGEGYWVACKSGAIYPFGTAGRVPTN